MQFFNLFIQFNLTIILPIIGFGIAYYALNRTTEKMIVSNLGWDTYAVMGFFGVPIHEMSHLIANIIFRHKITGICLYRPIKGKDDGLLGYVNFRYNPLSLYQNIGVFFSSIAPMLGGIGVILLLMKFLLPETFSTFNFDVTFDNLFQVLGMNIKNLMSMQDGVIFSIIFIIFSCMICMNMHLSTMDLKNSLKGLVFLEVAVGILSAVLGLVNVNLDIMKISAVLIFILIIGFIFSLFSMLLSLITLIAKAWD